MARNAQDIINLKLQITGFISLDWERISSDPVWRVISQMYSEEDDLYDALVEYINHYLRSELLLTKTPSTNGPATVFLEKMEIINNG